MKRLLSVLILLHLFAVLLTPNRMSVMHKSLSWLEYYVNPLGLTPSWNFFAPEAGSPTVFLEWELLNADDEILKTEVFPEFPNPFWLRDRQNRRITLVRFMALDDRRVEKMMGAYVCRTRSEAHSVRIWRVVDSIPKPEEVREGKRRANDQVELERKMILRTFCDDWRREKRA